MSDEPLITGHREIREALGLALGRASDTVTVRCCHLNALVNDRGDKELMTTWDADVLRGQAEAWVKVYDALREAVPYYPRHGSTGLETALGIVAHLANERANLRIEVDAMHHRNDLLEREIDRANEARREADERWRRIDTERDQLLVEISNLTRRLREASEDLNKAIQRNGGDE